MPAIASAVWQLGKIVSETPESGIVSVIDAGVSGGVRDILGYDVAAGTLYLMPKEGGVGVLVQRMPLFVTSPNDAVLGVLQSTNDAVYVGASSATRTYLRSGTALVGFDAALGLFPSVAGAYPLGGASNRWATVYATDLSLSGSATILGTMIAGGARLDAAAGSVRQLTFTTAGVARHAVYADSAAESGANAGSNYALSQYSDAGAYLGTALLVLRASGDVVLASDRGTVRVGVGAPSGAEALRVAGGMRLSGGVVTGATITTPSLAVAGAAAGSANLTYYVGTEAQARLWVVDGNIYIGPGGAAAPSKVLGQRRTGWGLPTGTLNRAALSDASAQVDFNRALMALITDLHANVAHGLIGP